MINLVSIIASRNRRRTARYIELVEAAKGSAVSLTQREAIGVFNDAERSAGRGDTQGRLYLPIWGNAAANAICLKTLTTGSFAGGVTHAAGYVQGDGTTGYLLPDAAGTLGALGVTNGNAHLMLLVHVAEAVGGLTKQNGLADGGTARLQIQLNTTSFIAYCPSSSAAASNPEATGRGIAVLTSSSTLLREMHVRSAAGMDTGQNATNATNVLPNLRPAFLARNTNGSINLFNAAGYGAFGYGVDLNASSYTANLKTLWETCTGLALP